MIVVTVGTEQYPFNRLMHWINLLIKQGLIQDEVVIQSGTCTVRPDNTIIHPFLKEEKFRDLLQQADLIIAHCGEGTVLLLDSLDKPYILVPRSFEFKEHVDNHQIEMATALEAVNVPIARSPGDLVRFLDVPRRVAVANLSQSAALSLCQSLQNRFSPSQQFSSPPSASQASLS